MAAIVVSRSSSASRPARRARPRRVRRVPRPHRGAARAQGALPVPRGGRGAGRARARGGRGGAGAPARRVPPHEGGGRWLRERLAAERDRFFRLGPAPLAPRAERRLAPQEPRRAREAHARVGRGAAEGVALAHGTSLPARRAVPGAVSRASCADAASSTSTPRSRASRASSRPSRSSRCSSCARPARSRSRRRRRSPRSGSPAPRRKDRPVDRPLRLISTDTTDPIDALARTIEALLVVASQPLTVAELVATTQDDAERVETALGLLRERYSEGRSGIVLEQVPAATRFVPRARRPRRARGCSSARSSEACRRRRSRPSRSSRTSGPCHGRRSPGSAASPPTRPSRRSSSAASSPRPGARARRAAPFATASRRCSSACSGSRRWRRCRGSTTSAGTPTRSAIGCSKSPRRGVVARRVQESAERLPVSSLSSVRPARRRRAGRARLAVAGDPVDVELGLPIMKSTWILLWLTCALLGLVLDAPAGSALPSAMWLAAFSSISVS